MDVVTGAVEGATEDADAAFVRAVYEEHGNALLGYAARLGSDRVRAEDLVQETLVRVWRHADRLARDDRPLRPWLFTVLTNVARDAHRAREARPTEVSDAALVALPADDQIDRALQAWQIADALRTLSEEHRAALVETYYLGRSVNEAAQVLGVPTGTVKSRCFYALKSMRLALQERGYAL